MIDKETQYPLSHITKEVVFLKHFITNPNIQVGDYTYYHDMKNPEAFEKENVIVINACKLVIGKFCQIAHGTKFIMGDANHQMNGFSTFPFFIFGGEWGGYRPTLDPKGDTIIGNDVWFGHESVVMPAVNIGDGAIIGARSVVTKDVPPYTIVAGNPAKVIRSRFSEEEVKELQTIKWWDWDYERITQHIEAIIGSDITALKGSGK